MALHKVNDNGPLPGHPQAGKSEPAMRETQEDAELADSRRAKREGLCGDYTRAPWFVKE